MSLTKECPVPIEQIPLVEFMEMKNSWFLSWSINNPSKLVNSLLASWLIMLPISIIIQSGNFELVHNTFKLIIVSSLIIFMRESQLKKEVVSPRP